VKLQLVGGVSSYITHGLHSARDVSWKWLLSITSPSRYVRLFLILVSRHSQSHQLSLSAHAQVPLMRCIPNFLCQFGLAGAPSQLFHGALLDDPQWLPAGKDNRKNELGVKRFPKGYFSYAGAGPNSRGVQLFVALKDQGQLGGGSPWEVPWVSSSLMCHVMLSPLLIHVLTF
jgi:hypothetical protein